MESRSASTERRLQTGLNSDKDRTARGRPRPQRLLNSGLRRATRAAGARASYSPLPAGPHLAEDLGMRPLQAHCRLGLGMLYRKMYKREYAHAELFTAIELYRTMYMTFWLPQAEAALVEVQGR
jgi:hypothetical protein